MKKITLLFAVFAAFTMNAQVTVWEDGFESYNDFDFDPIGSYTQIDVDGSGTYGSSTYDFTNENYVGTAIIFNPAATTPAATGTDWDVRTGEKGLYFFAATAPPNDDYIITPQINLTGATGSSFSFWAKTIDDTWGLEQMEVLLSTSGTTLSDFTENLTGGVVDVPTATYTEYNFDLSAYDGMQVYIAIHYVSNDTFVLQLDDFLVEAASLSINDNVFDTFNYFVDANNVLNLRSNAPLQSIELYNILGQQVVSKNLSGSNETINIANLQEGVYIAKVTINGATKSFKIIRK